MAVQLCIADDVFDGSYFMLLFSHEMSWMRSGTKLSQVMRIFLPTFMFRVFDRFNLLEKIVKEYINRNDFSKL